MEGRKSLETMSGVILNWLQPKFVAKLVANAMFESHVVTSLEGRAASFDLKIFFSNLLL